MLSACFLLFCLAAVSADVVSLTGANFEDETKASPLMLVKWFAPWCGHCQTMAEDYAGAATELKAKGIQLAEVDCIENPDLADANRIQGFPTLKLYRNGVFYREYDGGREKADFIAWMEAEAAKSGDEIGEPEKEEEPEEWDPEAEGEGEFGGPEGEEFPEDGEFDSETVEDDFGAADDYVDPVGFFPLDRYTYDKVVGVGKFDILVKFDNLFPDSEKEIAWGKLCERVGAIQGADGQDLIVASVSIADFDRFENDDIRARYNFEKDQFPIYRLWKRSAKSSSLEESVPFEGEIDADALSQFLMDQLSIHIGLPGCVKELDRLANGFLSLGKDEQTARKELAAKVLADTAEGQTKTSVEYYVKVMQQVIDEPDGNTFPAAEKMRLSETIVEQGWELPREKKDELSFKVNILSGFTEKTADF